MRAKIFNARVLLLNIFHFFSLHYIISKKNIYRKMCFTSSCNNTMRIHVHAYSISLIMFAQIFGLILMPICSSNTRFLGNFLRASNVPEWNSSNFFVSMFALDVCWFLCFETPDHKEEKITWFFFVNEIVVDLQYFFQFSLIIFFFVRFVLELSASNRYFNN